MGYGVKHQDTPWNPISPPDVQSDPEAKAEKPEPTPLEAPPEPLEPLTAPENNEGEGEGDD